MKNYFVYCFPQSFFLQMQNRRQLHAVLVVLAFSSFVMLFQLFCLYCMDMLGLNFKVFMVVLLLEELYSRKP